MYWFGNMCIIFKLIVILDQVALFLVELRKISKNAPIFREERMSEKQQTRRKTN